MSRYIHSQQATNKAFKNLDFSDVGTMQEIICCSNRIKMVQKPRKIKVFRGFTISKWADIV